MSQGVESSPDICIRQLGTEDAGDYRILRLSGLKNNPEAFGSSYAREAAWPVEQFMERLSSSLVLGAFDRSTLVGTVAFRRDGGPRSKHKGFLWGFFVEPHARGKGVGKNLVSLLIKSVEKMEGVEQIMLSVVEENQIAASLYKASGFEVYGLEPKALRNENGYSNEILMVKFL